MVLLENLSKLKYTDVSVDGVYTTRHILVNIKNITFVKCRLLSIIYKIWWNTTVVVLPTI